MSFCLFLSTWQPVNGIKAKFRCRCWTTSQVHSSPQVSDSLPIHQPHHTCYLGSCHHNITCDRPLEPFTHSENHGNKTSNAKGLLYSTLPPSSCVVRVALECVELFTPALNGIGLLYIFSSYIWSFFYCFVYIYPCWAVISLCFAYL